MYRGMLATALLSLTAQGFAAIVINELHYNPPTSQGDDNFYEFLELVNTGATAVSLDGWILSGVDHVFAGGTSIPAGGYLVVAKHAATIQTAYGLSGVVQWTSGNLDNGGELIRLQDAAFIVVDEVNYDDTAEWDGPLADGFGSSLELKNPALNNNTVSSWAGSSTPLGTPGAQNSVYQNDAFPSVSDLAHLPLQPGTADLVTVSAIVVDDHGLQTVTLRWSIGGGAATQVAMSAVGDTWSAGIGPFAEGSLVEVTVEGIDTADQSTISDVHAFFVTDHAITDNELMFTEIQYTDACFGHDDWVELHNASTAGIDLGGWVFKDNDDAHLFTIPAGTMLAAGGYLVLAGNAALLAADYGITNVIGDVSFGLSSTGDAVRLFTPWGVLVDAVAYGIVAPWPGPPVGTGPSLSLISSSLDNSQGASWQASNSSCGTPGLANNGDIWPPVVEQAGIHGTDRVRVLFNERVDETSAETSTHYLLDGMECLGAVLVDSMLVELDFGMSFIQGQVVQLSVAGVEDPAGNPSLPVVLPLVWWPAGSVVINEIMQNPLAVGDATGEWFEIHNPNAWDVDLSNWWLRDDGTDGHLISPDAPLVCPAGAYLVLAANSDPLLNGGITPDYTYSGVTLTNGADEINLMAGLTLVDRVAYDGGILFPDPNGASMELRDPVLDNADGANWQAGLAPFGLGDLGTPGSVNSAASLPAPIVQIAPGGGQVLVSWLPVPGAVDYVVESADGMQSAWTVQSTTSTTSQSLPISSAVRLIRVRARN